MFWPFFLAGEREERTLANRRAPGRVRTPPEIFCLTVMPAKVAFGEIVGEGDTEVEHEGEDAFLREL